MTVFINKKNGGYGITVKNGAEKIASIWHGRLCEAYRIASEWSHYYRENGQQSQIVLGEGIEITA